jgi:hypothetical protein
MGQIAAVKYWEIIADNLSKAGGVGAGSQQLIPTDERSPPRECTHQTLPFVQASAKAQFAGCVETQLSVYLATLSAFCVG